jgi:hypothetical protein
MFPFENAPGWYEAYWYGNRAHPKRMRPAHGLARFAVLIVLLAGSGMALSHFHARPDAFGAHDRAGE